jgi:hypothetical protein
MSPFDDDSDVTPRRDLDDRTVELLLSGREVAGESELGSLIGQVRSLADTPAPAPSSALAAILEDGLDAATLTLPVRTAPSAVSWRRRSWALPLQLSLAATGCLALILGAAAANELPSPAQTAVANAVEAVTPLHVPRPASHPAPAVAPTPTRTAEPASHRNGHDPSPRATHSEGTSGRTGNDDHRVGPSPSPNDDRSGSGGEQVHPRVSSSPDDLQPADKSGDGSGSGDRRKSGTDSGSGSGHGSDHGTAPHD